MRRLLRIILSVVLLLSAMHTASAEYIKVFSEGDGRDRDTAVRNALKSALEQAYGTFISSNTEILNDEVIADDMVSLQYGNVQNYKVISEGGDSIKYVYIEAIIDRDRLAQYVQNKGVEAELAGNTFAMNIRLAKFNAQNIERTLSKLISHLSDQAQYIYDYKLEVAEPILAGRKVYVPIAVKCYLNKNAYSFFRTADDVCNAVEKAIKSNRINGNCPPDTYDRIAQLQSLLPHIQRIACYNFIINDNEGNMVKAEGNDGSLEYKRKLVGRKANIIKFPSGLLESSGINIMTMDDAEYNSRNSKLIDYINSIKLRWNRDPYHYHEYMIDRLIEVPYESTRQMNNNTAWFNERYEMYPQQLRKGLLNGTVRMVLVYDVDQIAKVKKIEVHPDI